MLPALLDTLSCTLDDFGTEGIEAWTTLFGIIAELIEHYKAKLNE